MSAGAQHEAPSPSDYPCSTIQIKSNLFNIGTYQISMASSLLMWSRSGLIKLSCFAMR